MPETAKKIWSPHPGPQTEFLSSPHFEVFFGGAAGPGKSDALLMGALRGVGNPRYRAILLRRSFPELNNSLIPRSREIFGALESHPTYNGGDHRWTFPSGATIQFGHLQFDDTVHDYQSSEYQYVGFDELTHFSEMQYLYMLSRCRSTDPALPKFVRSASNPGSIGHAWVKKRFVDPGPYAVTRDEMGLTRTFIPGVLSDNPSLDLNDPGYRARLMALPEAHRNALLYGRWDSFEGQYFLEWRRDLHVVRARPVPMGSRIYRSVDWGYSPDPAVCLWFWVEPDGHVVAFREYVVNEQLSSAFARSVVGYTDGEVADSVGDPSMWSRSGQTGESIAETMIRAGLVLRPADNDRINGWMRVHEMLACDRAGRPWLQFTETCTRTIKSLPELVHDIKKPGDLDTTQDDHCADALRYFVMGRPRAIDADKYADMQHEASINYEDAKTKAHWQSVRRRVKENMNRASGRGGSESEICQII